MKTRSLVIIGIIVILAVSVICVSLVYNQEIKLLTGMMQSDEKPEPQHISGFIVETVAENLTIPWSIDWLPDGTALFTERNGSLRAIQNGELIQEPLLTLGVGAVEGGLLGVAVDPDFEQNNYIYLYYTYTELLTTSNKVVRYQVNDGTVTEDKVLINGIPGGPFHDGGRIQFGPDGKLYITTGEAGNPDLAQDLNSLGGKILRINSDGTIPEDNPWKDSPIYTIGHRNPQGIDWDKSGNLVATEHGPSGWRGVAHDEINLIIPGANYGWPDVIGDETAEGLQNPILHTGDDTWAPSGAEFYDGDKIPQWSGKYFVATLRGSHLHMIDFDLENNKVISHEKLFQDEFGRLRDVQTGPDGYLYILTSNQDGRGTPSSNDDRILRIVPSN
jgi:glucose/arabinose dehydrogenase